MKRRIKGSRDPLAALFIREYEGDARAGVQKLVEQARGRMEKLAAERRRAEELKKYEKEYAVYGNICGIDEVGRGVSPDRSSRAR